MVKHRPITDTQKVSALYTKKDNTPIKYVCTTSIQPRGVPMDVFYRDTPHPEFGNKYFGIYQNSLGVYMIAGADKVEDLTFDCIEGPEGWEYSSHVHDFKYVGDSFIDGGREYTRMGGNCIPPVKTFRVKDGEFASDFS
jgi:hypothetical protein